MLNLNYRKEPSTHYKHDIHITLTQREIKQFIVNKLELQKLKNITIQQTVILLLKKEGVDAARPIKVKKVYRYNPFTDKTEIAWEIFQENYNVFFEDPLNELFEYILGKMKPIKAITHKLK